MRKSSVTVEPMSGYAYELDGAARSWRTAKDDRWDLSVYTPEGGETLLGFRYIDGSRVAVFKAGGKAWAQQERSVKVGNQAKRGPDRPAGREPSEEEDSHAEAAEALEGIYASAESDWDQLRHASDDDQKWQVTDDRKAALTAWGEAVAAFSRRDFSAALEALRHADAYMQKYGQRRHGREAMAIISRFTR